MPSSQVRQAPGVLSSQEATLAGLHDEDDSHVPYSFFLHGRIARC